MTYTTHGHHIPDSPMEHVAPKRIARCGGVGLCAVCSSETAMWAEQNLLESAIEAVKMTGVKGHKSITQASRYQTKPLDVIVIQYEGGSSGLDISKWIEANGSQSTWTEAAKSKVDDHGNLIHPDLSESLMIKTHNGWVEVSPGDWIIQHSSGIFSVLPPDIFNNLYEPKE